MKNSRKGFILPLLAVLLMIVLGAGVCALEKNNSKQVKEQSATSSVVGRYAGWKTYANAVYHYSIEYPADWYIDTRYSDQDFTPRGPAPSDYIGGDTSISNYSPDQIDQYQKANGDLAYPADYIVVPLMFWKTPTQSNLESAPVDADSFTKESITLNGVSGIKTTTLGQKDIGGATKPNSVGYLFKLNGESVTIGYGFDSSNAAVAKIADQIINSFTIDQGTMKAIIDPSTYLPGKVFVSTAASGEMGVFNKDHTLTLYWGLDYAGPHDTRPRGGVGSWSVSGTVLTIKGALNSGTYDFATLSQRQVGNEIVTGTWTEQLDKPSNLVGFFIGKDLDTIGALTDVSFFRMLGSGSKSDTRSASSTNPDQGNQSSQAFHELKLSPQKSVVAFGDDLLITAAPHISGGVLEGPVPITLSIIAPDGTIVATEKTTWPLPQIACDPAGSGQSEQCQTPAFDPNQAGTIAFARLSDPANFTFLKSGTYRVTGDSEGGALTIQGFDFSIDSSVAQKIIAASTIGSYELMRFDALHQNSYTDYQMLYGINKTTDGLISVDVNDAGTSQNAEALYPTLFNTPIAPSTQTDDQKNHAITMTDYYNALGWISGSYVIRISPYLPADAASVAIVKAYLGAYPPNN